MKDSETTLQLKAISSKGILAKVVSQFGLGAYNLTEGIELIFEAIESIGYHLKKVTCEEEIEVEDFIIPKPGNFVKFRKLLDLKRNELNKGLNYEFGYDWCNGNLTYTQRTGNVILQYESTGVDNEGFPVIRDTFKYREAISYFLLLRFFEGGNKHPTLDISYAERQATKYRLRAKNEWKLTPEMVDYILQKWDYESELNNGRITTLVRYTDRDGEEVSSLSTGIWTDIQS